ncbi:MAG: hypothetical protein QM638_18715 [Nocardioides sp.]|uniref:hypothetical protein n=1 Tax=Nocardioides sp. TaxID=35761 RepID=UPI0039E2E692
MRLLGVLIALGAVVTLVIVLRVDDLVRTWAEGSTAARRILDTYGLHFLKDPPKFWPGTNAEYTGARAPRIVPVAVTLYVVLAGLYAVLAVFVRNGYESARISFTALVLFACVAAIGGMARDLPALIVVLGAVEVAVAVAMLVLLWLPASTRFFHPGPVEPASVPSVE